MQFCFHIDGGKDLYLRVPTNWDPIKGQWMGFFKLPESKKIVSAVGKTSQELQNNFILACHEVEEKGQMNREIFNMLKPLEYWEARE